MLNTGHAIARILHGLPSPRYPYQDWSAHRHWAKHISFDFKRLVQMAAEALLRFTNAE